MKVIKFLRTFIDEVLLGVQAILLTFDDVVSAFVNHVGQILEAVFHCLSDPMVKLLVVYFILFIIVLAL